MKNLAFTMALLLGLALKSMAYDFQFADLLYTIISSDPPQVRLDGHVDDTLAQGELVIPESVVFQDVTYEVKSVKKEAFLGCRGITGALVIPETVKEIYSYAFSDCTGLEEVRLPSQCAFESETYSYGVFKGCTGLASIEIPEGWETTGSHTFDGCCNLVSVVLPESLRYIGSDCFRNCSRLSEINIPQGLKEIGTRAFSCCYELAEFEFPASLTLIGGGAFYHCTALSGDLVIPSLVEKIPILAFDSCVGYRNLVIGESVNWMAEPAFDNTQFERIIIKATTPPELKRMTTANAWHLPSDIPIIVPCGTSDIYQNAEEWSSFTNLDEGVTNLFSATSADENAGGVAVLKEPACEDLSVMVEALPDEGGRFLYWSANGEQVSTDNPYVFVLEEDVELVAFFSGAGLEEIGETVSIYPNPTRGQLRLHCSPDVEPEQIELYDLRGRLVYTQRNGLESIDMEGLPAGTYTMRVTMADGKVFMDKVVKE